MQGAPWPGIVRRLVLTVVVAACVACQAGASVLTPDRSAPPPAAGISSPPLVAPSAAGPPASADQSQATAQATARAIQGTFMSSRYGYDWILPGGWSVTETPGTGGVHPGEPGLDTFTDGRGTTVTVGVTTVAPTQLLTSWICPVVAHLEDFHGEPREAVASMSLGAVPATISTFHFTAPPYRVLELEVQAIRGTQGFFLSWTDTLSPTVPDDLQRARFLQLLTGFSFA
jgi:hypothetical protein